MLYLDQAFGFSTSNISFAGVWLAKLIYLVQPYIYLFIFPILIIITSGVILWIWEFGQPLRQIDLETIFQDLKELPIILVFIVLSAQIYGYIEHHYILPVSGWGQHIHLWHMVLHSPLWLRIILAILLKDLIAYSYHLAMHHNMTFWRSHKWHHMQDQMYWLKGNKNSLVAKFIAKWDLIGFVLLGIPLDLTLIFVTAYSFFTFFVHSNIQWQPWMKYVEWVLVTPRYHMVHHSSNIDLQRKNLGDLFTFCDRIFGTYVNPETLDIKQQKFGILPKETLTLRDILGL